MASSGHIYKNRKDFNIYKTIDDVKLAAERSGNEARIDSKIIHGKHSIYTEGNVANTYADVSWSRQLVLIIYEYSYLNDLDAEVLMEEGQLPVGSDMSRVIYIDNVSDCEPVLLQFLYEYLKLNPEDVFCAECYNWYFTYEDIERIVQKQRVDACWYGKNPAWKNVDYWDRYLEINGNRRVFKHRIIKVLKYGEYYIVWHCEGRGETDTRNIYCVDGNADIVWQLENLYERYPSLDERGIIYMEIENGVIVIKDVGWKNEFHINIETGEVEKHIYRGK